MINTDDKFTYEWNTKGWCSFSEFFSEEHVEAYVDLSFLGQVTAIDCNQKIII